MPRGGRAEIHQNTYVRHQRHQNSLFIFVHLVGFKHLINWKDDLLAGQHKCKLPPFIPGSAKRHGVQRYSEH